MAANVNPFDNESYQPNQSNKYFKQLAILLGLIFAGFVLAAIVQFGFAIAMVDIKTLLSGNSNLLLEAILKPENINLTRCMQLSGTFLLMFLPAIIFAKIVHKNGFEYLGFNKKINLIQVLIIIAIAIFALALSASLAEVNKLIPISAKWTAKFTLMEEEYEKQVIAIASMKNFGEYILGMIMIAVLPAIFEEMLFRGALQNQLNKLFANPHTAIILTSIVFSAIHGSWYGFLPRLALGMILGYVFAFGKNIWLNILMHFINNGIAITAMYATMKKGKVDKDVLHETAPVWWAIIALVVIFYLMNLFIKASNNNKEISLELKDF
jgi:uncharacterized protein